MAEVGNRIYRVGDSVLIKSGLSSIPSFVGVNGSMADYEGRTATIVGVRDASFNGETTAIYKIDLDYQCWSWEQCFFEPLYEDEYVLGGVEDFDRLLGVS